MQVFRWVEVVGRYDVHILTWQEQTTVPLTIASLAHDIVEGRPIDDWEPTWRRFASPAIVPLRPFTRAFIEEAVALLKQAATEDWEFAFLDSEGLYDTVLIRIPIETAPAGDYSLPPAWLKEAL